jgi:hypothetical protein
MQLSDGLSLLASSAGEIPSAEGDLRLFSKCRNELLRLPAFLRHYRRLGVRRFFIADNASTDGSTEYLVGQPDVHVFRTEGSFRAARGGTDWLNALLGRFGVGHWCVTVDIDELLYYPGVETSGLDLLTRHFDRNGYQAMACQLLDLYPDGRLRDTTYASGDDLLAAAPLFDVGPYRRFAHNECPFVLIYGGVRERVFFPESWRRGWRRHLHVTFYHRVLPSLPVLREWAPILAHRPVFPPCLTKVPLVRWDESSRYLNVNHFVSPRKLALESGVLLHFKLLQDFDARASVEAERGQYYDGAIEFRRYSEKLRAHPDLTFRYDGSVRLEDSAHLVRLGFMQDTDGWLQVREGHDSSDRKES